MPYRGWMEAFTVRSEGTRRIELSAKRQTRFRRMREVPSSCRQGHDLQGEIRASSLKYYAGYCFSFGCRLPLKHTRLSVRPPEVRMGHLRLRVRTVTTLRVGGPSAPCLSSITTRPSIRFAACTKKCSAYSATASRLHQCRQYLPGLPRRRAPAKNGHGLRKVPHRSRLEHCCTATERSPESIPAVGSSSTRAVRKLPQSPHRRSLSQSLTP